MKKILVFNQPDSIPTDIRNELVAIAGDYELLITPDEDEVAAQKDSIVASLGWSPPDLLLDSPVLEWIQLWSAGADWVVKRPELHEKHYHITTTAGIHGIPITEHIFGLILAFARDIHHSIRAQSRHEWMKHSDHDTFELAGKTMVLLGVGGIGRRTAEIASAIGMNVIGVRNNPSVEETGVSEMYGADEMLSVLPKADIVVNTLPITEQNRNLFGESEFRAMKKSSLFINVGRGTTVDEDVMIRALKEGWIAGAGLDVTAVEPLPKDSELWDMENVIITAHYSGTTAYTSGRIWEFLKENLGRFVSGQKLLNIVDKKRGY